jgi:cell division protein FtsB
MAIVGKRSDPVRLFARRLALLALFIVVIAACSALWDVYKKERDSRVLKNQAEAQLYNLTMQEDHLNAEIARLETARGKEEMLRQNYEMAREGENVIMIIEPPETPPVEPVKTSPMVRWMQWIIPFW